jgi:CRP-like cAMP-binding protein
MLEQENALFELIVTESQIDIQTGMALWHPGERLEGVYIVEYGCIEEYSPLGLEPIRRFHRGAWIGLEQVLNSDITLTTCIASVTSRVRIIPADELALIPRSRLDIALQP